MSGKEENMTTERQFAITLSGKNYAKDFADMTHRIEHIVSLAQDLYGVELRVGSLHEFPAELDREIEAPVEAEEPTS